MSNKPEHTADISAELRTLSRSAKQYGLQPTVYGKPINIYFAELADRIDAAVQSELSKMCPKTGGDFGQFGNAAKLYEAVRKLRARLYNNEVAYQQRYFTYSGWHWHKKAKEAEKWRVIFSDYRAECDDALGRPARICDKMDRHKAIRDCRVWLMRYGYKLTSRQDDVMMQTIYWLYDETKEAEVIYEKK